MANLLASCWRVRSEQIQRWSPFGMGTCSRDWCRSYLKSNQADGGDGIRLSWSSLYWHVGDNWCGWSSWTACAGDEHDNAILLGMQSGLLSLQQDNVELRTAVNWIHLQLERCFGILNGNIRLIALQPASQRTACVGRDAVEDAAEVPGWAAANDLAMMAMLMPTPRSLHDLSQEYHHGVGGRKAARLFSYSKRGRSKHRYSRCKVASMGLGVKFGSDGGYSSNCHRQDICCLWRSVCSY